MSIEKIVIPVAGYGTRMFPAATPYLPKALHPCYDKRSGKVKPIIQLIIEEALEACPSPNTKVCIIISPNQKGILEEYFFSKKGLSEAIKDDKELKEEDELIAKIASKITFVEQKEQKGFGHAILQARDFVGDSEAFIVMLGDHLYLENPKTSKRTCVQQLVDAYSDLASRFDSNQKSAVSITTIDTCTLDTLHLNGIVKGRVVKNGSEEKGNIDGKLMKLTQTVEKPSLKFVQDNGFLISDEQKKEMGLEDKIPKSEGRTFCYFGMDILPRRVFDCLQYNLDHGRLTKGEVQLRDAQNDIQVEDESKSWGMYGILIDGERCDTGIPPEFHQSNWKMHERKKQNDQPK